MDFLTQLPQLLSKWTSLDAFILYWLSAVGVAAFISYFLERRVWFQAFTKDGKFSFVLLLYILSALLLAWYTGAVTPATASLNSIFLVVIGGISAFLSGEWYHTNFNKSPATETL